MNYTPRVILQDNFSCWTQHFIPRADSSPHIPKWKYPGHIPFSSHPKMEYTGHSVSARIQGSGQEVTDTVYEFRLDRKFEARVIKAFTLHQNRTKNRQVPTWLSHNNYEGMERARSRGELFAWDVRRSACADHIHKVVYPCWMSVEESAYLWHGPVHCISHLTVKRPIYC